MNKLFVMAIIALTLGACAKDDVQVTTDTPENDGIVFELAAINRISTVSTKRPVYSQDSIQSVDTVTIYAFKSDGINYLFNKAFGIDGWIKGNTQKTYALSGSALTPGNYQFLAVGREKTGTMTLTAPVTGTTLYQNFSAAVTGSTEEIFAGNASGTVNTNGGGIRVNLKMTRQIAGILGYFKNIPTRMNGQKVNYLSLEISNTNNTVNLTTGTGAGNNGRLVLYRVDLTTRDTNLNGTYVGNAAITGVTQLANSQLNGSFLLPVTGITMNLVLYTNPTTAIKTWIVKDNTNATFSITANHFYSLGRKVKDNTSDGGTPGDTSDDDSAINLSSDQDINIDISPAWSGNYNLIFQ